MSELRITTVQSNLEWINPESNRQAFAERLKPLAGTTDLILLPEMFSTGFYMDPANLAEPFPGPTSLWMAEQASICQAVIAGSFIVEERGSYFNRLVWMQPNGKSLHYDKHHLFGFGGEAAHFTAGAERLIVRIGEWRICPLICYDLRFPVWSRNIVPYYDVLIYLANWPSPRRTAWTKLLQARAIENQSYVVGVNRIGTDGNNLDYLGDSSVIDFQGDSLFTAPEGVESIHTTVLSQEAVRTYRSRFPFLESADSFEVLRD
ncbi:MAG: amidohydrolase [Saprospiraceae bacterium]|nr:amidohydrolase [Saprospiraceae bacterium]